MNKPRETPLTDALLAEYPALYLRPMEPRERRLLDLSRFLERTVAELREYAVHRRECASICRSGRDPIYCTCGLDALLARLDGSKP